MRLFSAEENFYFERVALAFPQVRPCLPSSCNDEFRILHGSSILTRRLLRLSGEGSSRNGNRCKPNNGHLVLNLCILPNGGDVLDDYKVVSDRIILDDYVSSMTMTEIIGDKIVLIVDKPDVLAPG